MTKLGKYERDESITEMKHADQIIERILFLEGLPNSGSGPAADRRERQGSADCDFKLEMKAIGDFRAAVAHCELVKDYVTRDLLTEIMHEEEKSIDFLEVQFDLITRSESRTTSSCNPRARAELHTPAGRRPKNSAQRAPSPICSPISTIRNRVRHETDPQISGEEPVPICARDAF